VTTIRANTQAFKLQYAFYEKSTKRPFSVSLALRNGTILRSVVKLTMNSGAFTSSTRGIAISTGGLEIDQQGALFVTRFKKNTALKGRAKPPVAADSVSYRDELVRFSNKHPGAASPQPLHPATTPRYRG